MDGEYVMVQTFPETITRTMINNANATGIILEVILIMLFCLYIIYLLVNSRKRRKILEAENRDLNYVLDSVSTLFARFALVDFETDTYRYLADTIPENDSLKKHGQYQDFVDYLCAILINDENRNLLREQLNKDAIIKHLGTTGSELRYENQVLRNGHSEWEHMSIVCLERKDGKASKVVFMRQNTTEIKERELKTQAQIALANRKERQFMTAVTSDAICTHEFYLTKDLIEQELIRM